MKHAVIFVTYKVDDTIRKHFNQLKNDLSKNNDIDIWIAYNCSYSACSIKHDKIFNYNKQLIERDGFKLHYYYYNAADKDFYGHNNDLVMIDLFKNNQEYDRYWFVDYDVIYTGDWNDIITYFDDFEYDFICSNLLMNHRIDPCFKVYPYNVNYDYRNQLHGFTNLMMLSNRALQYLLHIYERGAYGFLEVFFPSVLSNNKGLDNKEFILGTFNEHYFVDGHSQDDDSTMSCRDWTAEEIKDFLPNTLYHAVKNEF